MSAAGITPLVQPAIRIRRNPSALAAATVTSIDSRSLLRGQRAVHIEHHGTHYCLRHTRNGKLILTK